MPSIMKGTIIMQYDFSTLENTLERMQNLNSTVFKNLSPTLEIVGNINKRYAEILKSCGYSENELKILSNAFPRYSPNVLGISRSLSLLSDSMFPDIALKKSIGNMQLILGSLTSIDITSITESSIEDDYVTFDEAPIKEWELPDTIVIPIGNNRVRMKTEIFISIIASIIIPVLFGIAGLISNLNTAQEAAITEKQRLEIEEERNDLIQESNQLLQNISDVLNSANTTNSSKAETVEELKVILQGSDSVQQATDSTHDRDQENHNNNPE